MFVCVCTYHEPVAGYTYLNSLPVYKVIKHTFISYSQCVNKNKKNTLYLDFDSQKHKNTNAVCVCVLAGRSAHFYSGVIALLLLWRRPTEADVSKHHSTGLAPNMPNHLLYHWGWVGGIRVPTWTKFISTLGDSCTRNPMVQSVST